MIVSQREPLTPPPYNLAGQTESKQMNKDIRWRVKGAGITGFWDVGMCGAEGSERFSVVSGGRVF